MKSPRPPTTHKPAFDWAHYRPEVELFEADTQKLARVFGKDWDKKENWYPPELVAIMDHQWTSILLHDLADRPSRPDEPGQSYSLRDLMLDPSPPQQLVLATRSFAESQLKSGVGTLPVDVARVIYYASLMVGLCRCGETTLDRASLLDGADWVMGRDWVNQEIKQQFAAMRAKLIKSGSANGKQSGPG